MVNTRLTVLRDSQTISQEVFNKVSLLIERLKDKDLITDSNTTLMMVTHIAMALQRIQTNEQIEEIDPEIKDEINTHENNRKALSLWEENNDIFIGLAENEKYYILANFCNIL